MGLGVGLGLGLGLVKGRVSLTAPPKPLRKEALRFGGLRPPVVRGRVRVRVRVRVRARVRAPACVGSKVAQTSASSCRAADSCSAWLGVGLGLG